MPRRSTPSNAKARVTNGALQYAQVRISAANAVPGKTVSIALDSTVGAQALWSLGDPSSPSSGLSIEPADGELLPLRGAAIHGNTINVDLSSGSGGDAVSFSIGLWVCAPVGTTAIALVSASDPSIMIQAALGDAAQATIGTLATELSWP